MAGRRAWPCVSSCFLCSFCPYMLVLGGRFVSVCLIVSYWNNNNTSLNLCLFVFMQDSSHNLHLPCQSLYFWRVPSCFCLHTRGRSTYSFTTFTLNIFKNMFRQITLFSFFHQVFPTENRALAMGTCSAMAKVGALITPFVAQV